MGRLFDPDQLDRTWVGDITYIPTDEGLLYLASVLDLASRRLLGWSMAARHDAGLVVDALDAAVAARGAAAMDGTVFHTDPRQRVHLRRLRDRLRPAWAHPVDGAGRFLL